MRYAARASLPDRPGGLAGLASALSRYGVDIVHLDLVDRYDGVAVDDLQVDCDMGARALRRIFEVVPGVALESLAVVGGTGDLLDPTSLAAAIVEAPHAAHDRLVKGVTSALSAQWSMAVADGEHGLEVLSASPAAPSTGAGLRLPFLPLRGPRRLPTAEWMPAAWRSGGTLLELAAAPLHGPRTAVLLAREEGPRFRPRELARLAELARVAAAADRTVIQLNRLEGVGH